MFIYEKNNSLNITFKDNKPVVTPDVVMDVSDNNTLTINDAEVTPMIAEEITQDTIYDTAQVIDSAVVVALNGNKISIPEDTDGSGVYHVVEGGYLTINGDGVIDGVGKNDYNMAIWADGGHVVINGGTFTNVGATSSNGDNSHFDLIYAKNDGVVEINGGFFHCQTPQWTLNNNDTKPGTFIVRGGTFVGFNPMCTKTEPAGKPNNFVAEGYTAVYENGNYTVRKI